MRTPDRITRHPQSGFIAHYGHEACPIKSMSAEERDHVLRIMVERYNAIAHLYALGASLPEEVHA